MRRKDRERADMEFFAEVFNRAEVLFLALNDDGFPYCFPVNFAKIANSLYIHCATSGRKLDCIARDPNVGFSLALDIIIDVAHSTTYYKSISGTGVASLVDDPEEKRLALSAIASHYKALCAANLTYMTVQRTGIIRIDILSISGKCNEPSHA